jgi:hypothetical protein
MLLFNDITGNIKECIIGRGPYLSFIVAWW